MNHNRKTLGAPSPFHHKTHTPSNLVSPHWQKVRYFVVLMFPLCIMLLFPSIGLGNHGQHQQPSPEPPSTALGRGHSIPGVPFQIFLRGKEENSNLKRLTEEQAGAAIQTVVETLSLMTRHRAQYPRYDEALSKHVLNKVIIETQVFNREGKEFSFLVARTKEPGKVNLLISATALHEKGYVQNPKTLVPVLSREFQWVLIKADTSPKRQMPPVKRDLDKAAIKTNKEIREMSGEQRVQVLHELFQTYLTTIDDYNSLEGQQAYEIGSTTLLPPSQPDSTTKLYDIRVRSALQVIVRDPYFHEHTPKAVRSLLNGKIWNVSFAKIDKRDWATRTRVLPKDQAVVVGKKRRTIKPAKILVNVHRTAIPEDPFYSIAKGLPMGALSTDQLAKVIALEIQNNITDKSMRGHVAQDELTAPQ